MMNELKQYTDQLADDVADIDETLTDLMLRIFQMRQRWPRDSSSRDVRLALLVIDDIHEILREADRHTARLRHCFRD